MKQVIKKFAFTILAAACIAPGTMLAQQKEEKEKDKEAKDKKEVEQIIITRNTDKTDKLVIEVNGDKVTVNGKDVKDAGEGVTVHRNKIKDTWSYSGGNYNYSYNAIALDENRAMLGVTTDKVEGGVEIQEITKESAAEKAGLKKGDIITKIDDKKIETPDDLSSAIKAHKPGEKVSVTYLRDKKEQKLTAELTKWKGSNVYYVNPGQFKMEMDDIMPRIQSAPRVRTAPFAQGWSWSGGNGPKLGLSVQDSDDGKGVKVIDVDDDGNAAKAGIKEDDVITTVDGKAVKSTDDIVKIIKESKEKTSVKMNVLRKGKPTVLDVKIPRRVKTADL